MGGFDWRTYIDISPVRIGRRVEAGSSEKGSSWAVEVQRPTIYFSPRQIEALSYALDTIANTGPDGEELIKKAFANNKSYVSKLSIQPTDAGSSACSNVPGLLSIDFRELSDFRYKTPEGYKAVSLTGALVHELFHMADYNCRWDVTDRKRLEACINAPTLAYEQRCTIEKAYNAIFRDELAAAFRSSEKSNASEAVQIYKAYQAAYAHMAENKEQFMAMIAEKAKLPSGSFSFPHYPRFVKETPLLYTPEPEKDATRYTDAFMAKHFPGEPMRGAYKNGHVLRETEKIFEEGSGLFGHQRPTPDPSVVALPVKDFVSNDPRAILRKPGAGVILSNVYDPKEEVIEGLGHFKQPAILNPSANARATSISRPKN